MKTQLQYPGGLSITIEHDEQFAPQVLEMEERDNVLDIIGLQKKVDDLNCEKEQLLKLCVDWEKENAELKTAFDNICIGNNKNVATIRELREEIQNLKAPAPEIPTRHVSPSQQENFFKKEETPAPEKNKRTPLVWSKKPCSKCGQLFQPTGPRSSVCSDCKQHEEIFAAGNDFSENPE